MRDERKTLVRLIQDAVDRGATTVEEVHKSIADLPLRVLEEAGLLRGPAREVKRLQDRTLGAIYGAIRDVNERVGTYAAQLLADVAGRRSRRTERAHEPEDARDAAAR